MLNHGLAFSLLAALAANLLPVAADWGDTVDPTFHCPAFTTCKQVCVPSIEKCPIEMLCNKNETLCPDGTCSSSSSCTGHNESPCDYNCAPVACKKADNYFDECNDLYGVLYDFEAACGEKEVQEKTKILSFTEPGFVFFYCWISGVTVALLGWCAYNQRVSPVPGSVQPLEIGFHNEKRETLVSWQTGYKNHPVGLLINFLTLAIIFGVQILLLWLVIQYYVQQGLITTIPGHFDEETQVLLAFEITWTIGFFWSLALKFPYSIRSLHFRRCVLSEATHVAICVHDGDGKELDRFESGYLRRIRFFFMKLSALVQAFMSFLFSDKNTFGHPRSTGDGVYSFVPVQTDKDGASFIIFRFRRYNFDGERFVPGVFDTGSYIKDIIKADRSDGLTGEDAKKRLHAVGENAIPIPKPMYWKCVRDEVSKPFYLWQNFMVWSYFPLWYFTMAFVWAIVILVSIFTVSYFQYRNEKNIYRISKISGEVEVVRDGKKMRIPHQHLVPGDVINVEPGMAFCDMILVHSGGSTLVDESALTGEANPVGKTALDPAAGDDEYSPKRHKRNTILAGTTVLEVDDARAIVTKTASFTARGEMIRDIVSFARHQFKFDVEVPIVLAILFLYAVFGFVITNYFIGEQMVYGFFYGIYVVGTILPSILPTVFTVSVGISDFRLSKKRIACTNSESILIAGKVTKAFFDKTGTLTKQGLDFLSARSSATWIEKENSDMIPHELSTAMSACHTLTLSKETGKLIGNPVDVVMFEASKASMLSPVKFVDNFGNEITVLKQFEFDHQHMTQSVIVRGTDGTLAAYVKGSGERLKKLCRRETLPSDFDFVLRDSARQGIYQISLGFKSINSNVDVQSMKREDIESDISFLGVINFKNSMREETPDVIQHLAEGDIQSIMVTGDSILTGICIAKESGIVGEKDKILIGDLSEDNSETNLVWRDYESDQVVDFPSSFDELKIGTMKLAISGEGFSYLKSCSSKLATDLMVYIRVYGRCTPNDKIAVVSSFIDAGFITMMCGDGGNDCGALKTAHVGVALSDAEASTVAPFTSLDKSITSNVEVLREGRCALASALASYKFMILYGQIETFIQIISAYFMITLSEWCWIFMDGIWTLTLAFALPLARAAPKLAPTRPTASILSYHTLSSVLGILSLNFVFIAGSLAYLWSQDWFQCRKWENSDVSDVTIIGDNYESEVIFIVAGAQYISTAMALNFGYEFRRGWFRNYIFVALATGFSIMHLYATMNPGHFSCIWRINCDNDHVILSVTKGILNIHNYFNTTTMPKDFQRGLVGMVIGNALVIAGWEYFVVNGIRRYMVAKKKRQNNERNNDSLKKLSDSDGLSTERDSYDV